MSASRSAAEALCRPSSTGLENGFSTRIVPGTGTSLPEVENPTGRRIQLLTLQNTSGGGVAESDSLNWPVIFGHSGVMAVAEFADESHQPAIEISCPTFWTSGSDSRRASK